MIKNQISMEITLVAFQTLLTKHKARPDDISLLIKIGFELLYAHNDELIDYQEPLDYFKLAHETAKTNEYKIITAHNYAKLLYSEYCESDKAIEVEQACIALNPQYSQPYDLMALMLLEKNDYQKSVQYAQIAIEKSQANNECNKQSTFNLGAGYYHLGMYQQAIEIFSKINDEYALYNLALCYAQLHDENALINTVHAIEDLGFDNLDELDIAGVYIQMADYTTAMSYIISYINKHDFGFCMLSYRHITYVIWLVDKALFYQLIEKRIKENQSYITELKTNVHNVEYADESCYVDEINKHQNIESQFNKGYVLDGIEPRYLWGTGWLGIDF